MCANVSGVALTDLSAPGIVTGWPRRPASSCAGRLGETHHRVFLARDGGSSRARPPERRGRKDSNITCIYQCGNGQRSVDIVPSEVGPAQCAPSIHPDQGVPYTPGAQ